MQEINPNLPLVSVLMTTYNREKYLVDAIESVLASTYVNFELIIVDDGSKDKTVEIALAYAAKDSRVKVFVNKKNLGDYPNRNQAAEYAKGKYLKYVDADDFIYPTGLQVLVAMMEANPDACWGLCSLIQIIEQPYPILMNPKAAYEHHFLGPGLFHKAPLSSIIKKAVFDKVGGFKPFRMVGDNEMWHRLALHYPVLLMPDGVVWYREHSEQEINSVKKFHVMYHKIKIHFLTHPDCPLSKPDVRQYLNNEKKKYTRRAISFLLHGNIADAKETWSFVKLYTLQHIPLTAVV